MARPIIDRERLQQLVAAGAQLVDVLPEEEYRAEHLPGATSLPLTRLDRSSAEHLDSNRLLVVYCADQA
jgi:rhodanese-related sulfurtransferase